MRVRRQLDVFLFVCAITLIAVVIMAICNLFIYSADRYWEEFAIGALVIGLCAIPMSWFVGTRLLMLNKLRDDMHRLINYDGLTDLRNRRSFLEKHTRHPRMQGVVALVDVDHFKSVNDSYGHFAGDDALRHVSSILGAQCRRGDLICRYGGEEFAVFFRDATGAEALALAERLRMAIERSACRHGTTTIFLTVSVGCAEKRHCDDIEDILKSADELLYQAKREGRNRVCWAWEESQPPGDTGFNTGGGQTSRVA